MLGTVAAVAPAGSNGLSVDTAYRVCSRCVMDTTDPDITFDSEGVCSDCRRFEEQLRRRLVSPERSEVELARLVARIKERGRGREYDCIVGVSGGTDSTYVAYLAKRLGLRVLAVHFDNGWDSERAVRNIERALKQLDIDLYTFVMDWEEFRDLQVSFLKVSTPDGEIPTDHAIIALLYQVAAKYGVGYIIDGGNFAAEGLMPETAWSYGHLDWRYIKHVQRRFGTLPLRHFPRLPLLRLAYYLFFKRISVVSLLNYTGFSKNTAEATLTRELGWEYYGGKHRESVYTDFYQSYVLPRKFNIDKRRAHLSSILVSSGELTRDQALAVLSAPPLSDEKAREARAYVLKKLCLSEDEFDRIMAAPIRSFHEYPNAFLAFRLRRRLSKVLRRLKLGHL